MSGQIVRLPPGGEAPSVVQTRQRVGEFEVEVELAVWPGEGGIPRTLCRSITVHARGAEGTVTSTALRSVPVERLIASALRAHRPPVNLPAREELDRVALAAAVYLDAAQVHGSPGVAVAEHLEVSRRTAGRYISLARERGLLPAHSGPGLRA